MKPLFTDPHLQKEFEENGFVKVPLLDEYEVETLTSAYAPLAQAHESIGIPYITTSHSNNAELITHVDRILQQTIAPTLDRYMSGYKLLFGNFLVKMPGNNSATEPHQDITFVDEAQFTSVNIWVALQDTKRENGCMYFLKGSHKLIPTIRPTHDYPWAYAAVTEEIKQQSTAFEAKAGDAFIFNHAVVHGSFQNQTAEPRLAAVLAACHAEAPLIHYYLPDAQGPVLQKYNMEKDAYLHFVKGQPPAKGVYAGEEVFNFRVLSRDEYMALVARNKPKKGMVLWLNNLFQKA